MTRIAEAKARLEALWQQKHELDEELAGMEARYSEVRSQVRLEQNDAVALQTMPLVAKRLQTTLREVERTITGTKEQLKLLEAERQATGRAIEDFEAKWGPLFLLATPLGVAVRSLRETLEPCIGNLPYEVEGAAVALTVFLDTLKRKERGLAEMRGQLADLGE